MYFTILRVVYKYYLLQKNQRLLSWLCRPLEVQQSGFESNRAGPPWGSSATLADDSDGAGTRRDPDIGVDYSSLADFIGALLTA